MLTVDLTREPPHNTLCLLLISAHGRRVHDAPPEIVGDDAESIRRVLQLIKELPLRAAEATSDS